MTREDALAIVQRYARWGSVEQVHKADESSIEMIDPDTGYHYWYDPQTGEQQGTTAPWQLSVG